MDIKSIIKKALGRAAIHVSNVLPASRRVLKPLGVRCSQGLFGNRTVLIPISGQRPLRLTGIDESYLAFQLLWRGLDFYEPISRVVLEELIQRGHVFFDLGAHVGFFSLITGIIHPEVRIFAFEPNPRNYRILRQNRDANGLSGLHCESVAISDRDTTAKLYLTESDMSASLMKNFQEEDTRQIGEIEVRTVALDTYVKSHGLQGPMVIKIDIEGHEPAFFRGAWGTLAECKPDLVIEILYEQEPQLLADLRSLGYRFYPITDEGMVEVETPKLFKRFPLLFLNYLFSARPKSEVAELFERVRSRTGCLDLLKTSKHFPPEEWPALWRAETATQSNAQHELDPICRAEARRAKAESSPQRDSGQGDGA